MTFGPDWGWGASKDESRQMWDALEAQAGEKMTVMYRWFENEGYAPGIGALKTLYPRLADFDTYLRTASFAQADSETAA